jgi:hypothetical protein
MKQVRDTDINAVRYMNGDVAVSYMTDDGRRYRQRYTGCGIRDAKRRFKEHIRSEEAKPTGSATRDDMLIGALRSICGGDPEAARRLLGDS